MQWSAVNLICFFCYNSIMEREFSVCTAMELITIQIFGQSKHSIPSSNQDGRDAWDLKFWYFECMQDNSKTESITLEKLSQFTICFHQLSFPVIISVFFLSFMKNIYNRNQRMQSFMFIISYYRYCKQK